MRNLNTGLGLGEPRYHTFEERCIASNMSFLVPGVSLDESFGKCRDRSWNDPPRKRIKKAAADFARCVQPVVLHDAIRHPSLLLAEAGIRHGFQSFSGSWRQVAAGLRAWGEFPSAVFLASAHFPACDDGIVAFASVFANPGTFAQYLSHVAKGERMLRVVTLVTPVVRSAVLRSAKAFHRPRVMPRIRRRALLSLVKLAVKQGDLEAGRLYIIAYSFLFPVTRIRIDCQKSKPCTPLSTRIPNQPALVRTPS